MGSVSRLHNFYGGFFKDAGYFCVLPYIGAFMSGRLITGGHMPGNPAWEAQLTKNGLLVSIALTIIPVLPILTAITVSLALIGMAIAALSTILTYPIAAVLDCAIPENNYGNQYTY